MTAWISPLPNGRYAILTTQKDFKGWYREIAAFNTYKEAVTYAQREFIELTQLKQPRDSIEASERKHLIHSLGQSVLEKIDELYALHPSGITAQTIMAHFKAKYETALEALRYLGYTGQAQWLYRGNDTRKFLFPNGVKVPPRADIGINQDKVLRAMAQAADAEGRLQLGYRDIGRLAGVTPNSVSHIIQALRTKGYVTLIQSGRTNAPNTSKTYNVPSIYEVHLTPAKDKKDKDWITFDDLNAASKTMSPEEFESLEARFWAQMGIDPEKDLYPAEEAKQRFETVLRNVVRGAGAKKKTADQT